MAFETNLIAISWRSGSYRIVSQTSAVIDMAAIKKAGLLADVSLNVGYIDEGAIFNRKGIANYLLPVTNPKTKETLEWYESLPEDTEFIIVHRAEWESGLGE